MAWDAAHDGLLDRPCRCAPRAWIRVCAAGGGSLGCFALRLNTRALRWVAALAVVSAAAARGEAALRQQFEDPVTRWVTLRERNRRDLNALGVALVAAPPAAREAGWAAFQATGAVYGDLAAPFDAEAHPQVGNPLVGLVVVGLVVSLVGVAWCWVSLAEQENLSQQIALQRSELAARVDALRWGQTLPPSTVAPPARPAGDDTNLMGGLPLLLGAGGLAAFLWWKTKGRRG